MLLLDTSVPGVVLATATLGLGLMLAAPLSAPGGMGKPPFPYSPSGKSGCSTKKAGWNCPVVLPEWRARLLDEGLVEIPVDGTIATRAGLLPNMHGDPADRIIIATALEGHQLVTHRQAHPGLARRAGPASTPGGRVLAVVAAKL